VSVLLPRRPAAPQAAQIGLRLPASPAFTAMAHPSSWSLVRDNSGAWYLLPRLVQIVHMVGVNGVRVSRGEDGRPVADPSEAIRDRQAQGWVLVPEVDVYAHGQTWGHYCLGHRVVTGVAYRWAWEAPQVAHGRSVVQVDRDAEVAFRRWVGSDLLGLPECPDDLADAHRLKMRDSALRLGVEAQTRPSSARRLEHLAAQLVSLGWADGIDLPAPRERRPLGRAVTPPPAAAPTVDRAAALAALGLTADELVELVARRSAASPVGALVGSTLPDGAAFPDGDDTPAPRRRRG
jgi:hypothetical protein